MDEVDRVCDLPEGHSEPGVRDFNVNLWFDWTPTIRKLLQRQTRFTPILLSMIVLLKKKGYISEKAYSVKEPHRRLMKIHTQKMAKDLNQIAVKLEKN